jgi:hypothetical protein
MLMMTSPVLKKSMHVKDLMHGTGGKTSARTRLPSFRAKHTTHMNSFAIEYYEFSLYNQIK